MGNGISVWVPLISAGAGIAGALGSQWLSHIFITRRERRASEEKLIQERLFIATELVFMLEQFAESCASVAKDNGYENQEGLTVPGVKTPVLDYSLIQGDWRALTGRLMYQVRELAVIKSEADRTVGATDSFPPDFDDFFCERQIQYTRLGLKALFLIRRLRRFVGFAETRLNGTPWSAQQVLLKEWHQERKRRSEAAALHAKLILPDIAFKGSGADTAGHGENT